MTDSDENERASVPITRSTLTAWALAHNLERWRELYQLTNNPVHAWSAWAEYRKALRSAPDLNIDLPDWIATYFDQCAEAVPTARGQRELVAAMGFAPKRGPSQASQAKTHQKHWDLARSVAILREKRPDFSEAHAAAHVAVDLGIEERVVTEAFDKFRYYLMK